MKSNENGKYECHTEKLVEQYYTRHFHRKHGYSILVMTVSKPNYLLTLARKINMVGIGKVIRNEYYENTG